MMPSDNDLYDRQTIEECLVVERALKATLDEISKDDPDYQKAVNSYNIVRNISLMAIKGERAQKKEATLQKWRDEDLKRKERVDSVKPRTDIKCLTCGQVLEFEFKTDDSDQERERVLLFYVCPNKCLPNRAFFDDGEEYKSTPTLCEKCQGKMNHQDEREGDVITTTYTCSDCGFSKQDQIDLTPRKEEPIDEDLRKEYCLDADGMEKYRQMKHDLEAFEQLAKSIKARQEDTRTNERMEKLQKFRVAGLKDLIAPKLEAIGMTAVEISNPNNDRGLKVQVSMIDSNQERSDHSSKSLVKKTINELLADTNWRFIKSSLNCTLGAITAELRGYTNDEEIRKIIETENESNTTRT